MTNPNTQINSNSQSAPAGSTSNKTMSDAQRKARGNDLARIRSLLKDPELQAIFDRLATQ